MTIASTSAFPTTLPAPQAVQPSGGKAAPSAASAPEADGGFANALQQARQGARLREAQADRQAEARRTERAGVESRSAARAGRPADPPAREVAEPSPVAAPSASGEAESAAGAGTASAAPPGASREASPDPSSASLPAVALPAWLESALGRSPGGSGDPDASTDAAGPGPGESATDAPGADRSAARRFPAGLGDSGRLQGDDAVARGVSGPDQDGDRAAFAAAISDASATPMERTPAGAAPASAPASAPGLEAQQTASVAASATPGVTAGSAAEAVERPVVPHVHSPEFAPALGAQLNILVKDGVSEARLHLNPAEMGPITVQIHIEGQTARVEMVAEHAATRQALEQSMPALAGALRDSGLTLAGGGVFEQARDPRQGEAEGRPARAGSGGASAASGDGIDAGLEPGRPARLPAGVVDVYA